MKTKLIMKPTTRTFLILGALAMQVALSPTQAQDILAPVPMVPGGYRLIEEDILVPDVPVGGFFPAAVFPFSTTAYWPGGVVPYEFNANVSSENRQAMLAAMDEWEAVANVVFVPRNGHGDYLHILNSTGNSSQVGRQGGRQDVNIVSWGSRFIIAHELGHALGYWHEQSAGDRDNFITINYANISPDKVYNFDKHGEARLYGPYDLDSVMHYGQYAFSANGQPTITVRPPNDTYWQSRIGQRDHLSKWDALVMSFIYSYSNDRFVDWSNGGTEAGTFFEPFRNFYSGTASVPDWGYVWITRSGAYAAVGLHSKPMLIQAPDGGVTLR